jgi:hypothetical protein
MTYSAERADNLPASSPALEKHLENSTRHQSEANCREQHAQPEFAHITPEAHANAKQHKRRHQLDDLWSQPLTLDTKPADRNANGFSPNPWA